MLSRFVPRLAKRAGEYGVRIETKMGVGLRYRRPKVWAGGMADASAHSYTESDIAQWRKDFNLPKMHSSTLVFYSDEELLLWRQQFDAIARNGSISLTAFEKMLAHKYEDDTSIDEKEIPSKVLEVWQQFDADKSNLVDFGEFIRAGFAFDVARTKEAIQAKGVEDVFNTYAEDGFISESQLFELMQDYKFTVASSTHAKKIMEEADKDNDYMLSIKDFTAWSGGA